MKGEVAVVGSICTFGCGKVHELTPDEKMAFLAEFTSSPR
jgi:hypothetical protein